MGLVDIVQKFKRTIEIAKFLRDNSYGDLLPGDVVKYKDRELFYMGLCKDGGLGMPGILEPVFRSADPSAPNIIYFLRTNTLYPSGTLPEDMRESALPIKVGRRYVQFLEAERDDLKKVRKIEPEEWERMYN